MASTDILIASPYALKPRTDVTFTVIGAPAEAIQRLPIGAETWVHAADPTINRPQMRRWMRLVECNLQDNGACFVRFSSEGLKPPQED